MINRDKLKRGGLVALLLVGTSASSVGVDATSSSPLASKPSLVRKSLPSSDQRSIPAVADLVPNTCDVVEKTIPRGGDGEVGLAVRLKVGSYFALWYILNIVYNSELSCSADGLLGEVREFPVFNSCDSDVYLMRRCTNV